MSGLPFFGDFQVNKSKQAAVIPKHDLFTRGLDIGMRFFQLTLGRAGLSDRQLQTLWATLKAISALGNLIVTTFTAARGKAIEACPILWRLTQEQ